MASCCLLPHALPRITPNSPSPQCPHQYTAGHPHRLPLLHHPGFFPMISLSELFLHPSSSPTSTSTSTTSEMASPKLHQPAPCSDASSNTCTSTGPALLEPQECAYKAYESEEDCGVIEDTFTFRLDKVFEYVHGHVSDTLRNPKLVLGMAWHEETSMPVGEMDVQFKAVSVVKISIWPRWTVPYVDVKVQTPASKAFKNALGSLATTAAFSAAIQHVQRLPNPLNFVKEQGKRMGDGLEFTKVGKGLRDVLSYGRPLLLAGAPLPLVLLLTSKGRGVWGGKQQ